MDVVLSIGWASAYQSVAGLVRHFAPAWAAEGLELVELSLGEADWTGKLQTLLKDRKIRFAFCTSGIGVNIEANGKNLWESLNLPVYSLLLDHPAYFAQHHRTQPPHVVLGYMFEDHARFQRAEVGAENTVSAIDYGIPDLPLAQAAGRPRVIFAKTGNSAEQLAEGWRQAPLVEAVLRDALDELALTRRGNVYVADLYPAVEKAASAHRLHFAPFSRMGRFLVAQLDDYLRRRKSTLLAQALLPFEVDVFGKSWEHINIDGARARFHGPVPYDVLEAQFSGATASLTMNPNIDHSAHDRFFTALGAGIMPVSDDNFYTRTHFPELAAYSYDFSPGRIAAALETVVSAPARARELAVSVRNRARPAHGVEETARRIVRTMQATALCGAARPEQQFFVP